MKLLLDTNILLDIALAFIEDLLQYIDVAAVDKSAIMQALEKDVISMNSEFSKYC